MAKMQPLRYSQAHAKMVQAMAKVRRQTAAEQRTRRTKAAKRAIAAQPASPVSRDPAITATSNAGLTGTVRPTAQQVAQRLYTHHTSAGQQVVDTASANNVAAAVPTANPEGNVVVVTYVDTPQGGAANGRDQRLGNVTVRVERVGGRNQCDNRKDNPAAKTNAVKTIQDNGKAVLVHGTAHFLGCSAGQYRVTLVGRKNYAPVSSQVKTFTLADDQTEVVPFVLKKQIPAADPAATVQQ